MIEFQSFPKIPRLSRDMFITEKIDGTNAQIIIEGDQIAAASRKRLITLEDDNFGFARWVLDHKDELLTLGPGRHFGEWWGQGIQRGYGLKEKRFSLFNVDRWGETGPACCHIVPVLYHGPFDMGRVNDALILLQGQGSAASPGFMRPEGIIIYHTAGNLYFKKTIEKDELHKGEQE